MTVYIFYILYSQIYSLDSFVVCALLGLGKSKAEQK